MPAKKISIDNAKQNKLFYFVVTTTVYRESDGRCLILKRSEREKVHPGKYSAPGGKLEWEDIRIDKADGISNEVIFFDDAVRELLKREVLEESGLKIHDDIKYLDDVVFIRPDETPVVLIKFAAKYKSGKVKLEEDAFSDYAWVNEEEIKDYDCIGGLYDEIIQTTELYRS